MSSTTAQHVETLRQEVNKLERHQRGMLFNIQEVKN